MELSQSELEKLLEEGSDRSSWPFLTCVEDLRNQDYALLEAPFKADRAPFASNSDLIPIGFLSSGRCSKLCRAGNDGSRSFQSSRRTPWAAAS